RDRSRFGFVLGLTAWRASGFDLGRRLTTAWNGAGRNRHRERAEERRARERRCAGRSPRQAHAHMSSRYAATSGNTTVASDSIMKRGVSTPSLPQVIFSPGGAPL